MTAVPSRSLSALVCAVVLGLTSMVTSVFVFGADKLVAQFRLLADEGFIMNGTGQPDPTVGTYLGDVLARYLQPSTPLFDGQPTLPGYTFQGLTTPEQFCPFVCLPPPNPQLNFGDSLSQGEAELTKAIVPHLQNGDNVAVLGYSQSATIATLEMQNLVNNPGSLTPEQLSNLHVVLIGDPNNPIGGLLDRLQFPAGIGPDFSSVPQHVPFVGIPLGIGPTPTGPFPTDIYTGEYDGFANFPQDPTNLLAVINALIGIGTVHGTYPTADNLADVMNLGSIDHTNFYMIPEQLPILSPIYQLGDFGKVVGDALAPGLTQNIDWAYGNPGDPFVGVNGTDAIGPWAVTATGQLVSSGAFGFFEKMDPLQMLAGMQYAGVQGFVNPINDILGFAGQQPLPESFVNSLLAGYDFTNQVDQFLLNGLNELATGSNGADLLGPDAIFTGAPLISGEPLLGLIGGGFSVFNLFGG
ncbi:MAG: PE-PPE domain-containing protein [Mycobacterium sp.]